MSYDYNGLYQFLRQTPEGALRKMLVDNKSFTEPHFNLLMKVTRTSDEAQFCKNFEGQSFPRIRFSPAEEKLKEKFWADCQTCFLSRGVLSTVTVKVAA